MSGFDAPGAYAPAELPPAFVSPPNIATLRYASAAYGTGPGDSLANTWWQPGILEDVELSQSAMDILGVGGRAALSLADVLISDRGRALADIARYGTAEGRTARLRAIPVTAPRASDFGAAIITARSSFAGVVRAMTEEPGFRVRVALSDLAERLNDPLQPTLYAGTGGVEGGPELKGQPKPVALGQVFNVPAIFLGQVNLGAGTLPTYQTHSRAIAGHDAVRIRGVLQAATGGTPTVGQYRDWPHLGMFQLGSTPDGAVTADLRGDVGEFYVDSFAGIIRRLLTCFGPQLAASDLDPLSFGFADLDLPGVIGFWQGAAPTTALAAIDTILAGCGAVLGGGRDGRLRLLDPLGSAPTLQFDIPPPWVIACEPVPLPLTLRPAPRAVEVTWRRNWSPLQDVAGSVADADRERLQQPGSTARAESAAVTGRVAVQRTLSLPGLYWNESEALARANIWRNWIERGPRAVRITTDRYLDQVELGHIGRVTYPAHGLQSGLTGVVVAWRERMAARRLEITLLGVPD